MIERFKYREQREKKNNGLDTNPDADSLEVEQVDGNSNKDHASDNQLQDGRLLDAKVRRLKN